MSNVGLVGPCACKIRFQRSKDESDAKSLSSECLFISRYAYADPSNDGIFLIISFSTVQIFSRKLSTERTWSHDSYKMFSKF